VVLWLSLVVCPDTGLLADADRNNVLWTVVKKNMKFSDMLEWEQVCMAVLLTAAVSRAKTALKSMPCQTGCVCVYYGVAINPGG
jgi:hypothetical protein